MKQASTQESKHERKKTSGQNENASKTLFQAAARAPLNNKYRHL